MSDLPQRGTGRPRLGRPVIDEQPFPFDEWTDRPWKLVGADQRVRVPSRPRATAGGWQRPCCSASKKRISPEVGAAPVASHWGLRSFRRCDQGAAKGPATTEGRGLTGMPRRAGGTGVSFLGATGHVPGLPVAACCSWMPGGLGHPGRPQRAWRNCPRDILERTSDHSPFALSREERDGCACTHWQVSQGTHATYLEAGSQPDIAQRIPQ